MPVEKKGSILTPRDERLMVGLFESRIMSTSHIARLYFEGKIEAAYKRLQRLKADGYLAERARRAAEPAVVYLTRKAFNALLNRGLLHDFPDLSDSAFDKRVRVSDLTVQHELDVMEWKTCFITAIASRTPAESSSLSVAQFSTWPALFQFKAYPTAQGEMMVKPDAFVRIQETSTEGIFEHTFFAEIDRSTETIGTLIEKACGYRDYYQRGGFAVRCGAKPDRFAEFPFRVLFVLKTAERRNNLHEALISLPTPILTQVWSTTFTEVIADPLGPVWTRPLDYRTVIRGTDFDPGETAPRRHGYRRQSERESFVESGIRKWRLLDEPA
jgi:hypothetical protein